MLDGANVSLGDSVYVDAIGTGTVVSLSSDGGFAVKVGNSIYNIRSGGYVGNVRKVYWHNPLMVIPPKNLHLWNTIKGMTERNYKMLQDLFREGNDGELKADSE